MLRLTDLEQGRILQNRELVDMTSPLARSKRHIEIALPPGMRYRTGDYLAVLPRNPQADVERVLRRFGLATDTQVLISGQPGSGIAPFHGFLQERAIQKAEGRAVGEALLFFGIDHSDVDYLYRDELAQWGELRSAPLLAGPSKDRHPVSCRCHGLCLRRR